MQYWLNLFTVRTWQEFQEAGAEVTGFRKARWPHVQNVQVGDHLVCYLVGAYRWVAVLEVTGQPFFAESPRIWEQDAFPARVPVRVLIDVAPIHGVPVLPMLDRLEAAAGLENRDKWGTLFLGSPRRWPENDGELVFRALQTAKENPVEHELPAAAFRRPAEVVDTDDGPVTVPADEEEEDEHEGIDAAAGPGTEHTEMQYLLARIGHAMGYQVYIAQGDRSKVWRAHVLGELPGITSDLQLPFPEAALRVIRHIDVLWLDADMIRAAWEIERTTSIFSGLLRMTDLLTLQPNLSMPMYIVAPDERREKVADQLHRPTFARMRPRPLSDLCRYMSFDTLRKVGERREAEWRYTRFEFISEELAETLEPFGV